MMLESVTVFDALLEMAEKIESSPVDDNGKMSQQDAAELTQMTKEAHALININGD